MCLFNKLDQAPLSLSTSTSRGSKCTHIQEATEGREADANPVCSNLIHYSPSYLQLQPNLSVNGIQLLGAI